MFPFSGGAAAITGAASGIGRALAIELAARGCDLALADIDESALHPLAEEIERSFGRQPLICRVDVADQAQVQAFATEAAARFFQLRIVINNAGVALLGQFQELGLDQIRWLLDINFWGVVHGTQAFLPYLQRQPRAHIVNISSIFGMIAAPGHSAYAASKFAVRGFSESLRHELAMNRSPVQLSVVHPGGVRTNIARNSRPGTHLRDSIDREQLIAGFDRLARTSAPQAAQRIVRGIERNQGRILIGADARLMDLIQRLCPVRYWALISKFGHQFAPKAKR